MYAWNKVATYYEPALYLVVGLLLLLNIQQLASGVWMALLPIAVQGLTLASVAFRLRLAYVIVRIWALICIVAGACLWIAILLAGGKMVEPTAVIVNRTLFLVIGLFFFAYARTCLARNSPDQTTDA